MNVILRDGIDHVYPELHAAVCVVRSGVRDAADAVVAVAQQLDTETVVLVSELVKPDNTSRMREGRGGERTELPGEQFIEETDQLLRSTLGGELSEAADVGKENTKMMIKGEYLSELNTIKTDLTFSCRWM